MWTNIQGQVVNPRHQTAQRLQIAKSWIPLWNILAENTNFTEKESDGNTLNPIY